MRSQTLYRRSIALATLACGNRRSCGRRDRARALSLQRWRSADLAFASRGGGAGIQPPRFRQFPRLAETFEVSQHVPRFLQRLIGRAVEERREGRHHRIGYHRAWRIEMLQLPVVRASGAFAREIRPDPARTPEVRVIETRFPGLRRLAKPAGVAINHADLLGMTVRAAFPRVDLATALFARSQGQRILRRHLLRLFFENLAWPHSQHHHRHREEPDAAKRRDQQCRARAGLLCSPRSTSPQAWQRTRPPAGRKYGPAEPRSRAPPAPNPATARQSPTTLLPPDRRP